MVTCPGLVGFTHSKTILWTAVYLILADCEGNTFQASLYWDEGSNYLNHSSCDCFNFCIIVDMFTELEFKNYSCNVSLYKAVQGGFFYIYRIHHKENSNSKKLLLH